MFVLVLGACSFKETQPEKSVPKLIEAKLEVPEKAAVKEEITITTTLMQNGKPVNDADEVTYEIWKTDSKEKSEMLNAEPKGKGVYTIQKTFNEEAVYNVQVHVTARGLHTMPKASITVGNTPNPAPVKN